LDENIILKSRGFKLETSGFAKAEQQVHVLHCLSAGAFQQVIQDTGNKKLVSMLFEVNNTFIGINNLFQVDVPAGYDRKRMAFVKLFEKDIGFLFGKRTFRVHRSENTTGKVAALWDEIQVRNKSLQATYTLPYFFQVLVTKDLIS
jgi:hypothetical protein